MFHEGQAAISTFQLTAEYLNYNYSCFLDKYVIILTFKQKY